MTDPNNHLVMPRRCGQSGFENRCQFTVELSSLKGRGRVKAGFRGLSGVRACVTGVSCFPLVLCKTACFSLGALDLAEDLVGVLGPGERDGVVVPVVDEGADGGGQFPD